MGMNLDSGELLAVKQVSFSLLLSFPSIPNLLLFSWSSISVYCS